MTRDDEKPVVDPQDPTPEAVPAARASGGNGKTQDEPSGLELADSPAENPVERERDELRQQLLRKRADFENYRRRVERDRQKAEEDAAAGIFRALIPTLDNLERALGATGADESSIREGVTLIHRELVALLESHGVASQDPTGKPFDPQKHQALAHEPAPGVPDGTVVKVFQRAYFLKDRLLRPALVSVAKGEEPADGAGPNAIH